MGKVLDKIDGESISKSIALVLDKIKYRKFAASGYTIVIWMNKENTLVKILDGNISDKLLNIPSQDATKMVDKVYIAPSKKLVTKLCFVKEDINTTLDLTYTDTSALTPEMFKRFVNIKLLDDLQSFNLGQVMLGGALGLVAGVLLTMLMLIMYGVVL
jgi:hypothetical protein